MSQTFEHCDMAGSVFRDVNLGGATFEDVNLAGATIRNANLAGVTIRNANLEGFRIEDANIEGLMVFGFRVDELIDAECDRRDPERARLKMRNLCDPESVHEVMARLEEIRAAFRQRLCATDVRLLAARPGADEWSALENVRHMLFAEDLYLNRLILQNDKPWNRLGLLPEFLQSRDGYEDVGCEPSKDLETVLAAWDAVHTDMQAFLADLTPERLQSPTRDLDGELSGTVGGILQGLTRHDLEHIRQAEAALAALEQAR
ncbi:MAG: DinB family protein [Anaerolineae bacterium]|nr:DinB family protein [Anaerolineae bacterium]